MKRQSLLLYFYLHILILGFSQNADDGIIKYKTENSIIYDICFTYTGDTLAAADHNSIKFFLADSGKFLYELNNGHKDQILTLDISINEPLLASGGKDKTIIIWDFKEKKIVKTLNYQASVVTSVKISPNGRYLLSGGTNNMVYLYDIKNDTIIGCFSDHSESITAVTFSPDGSLFATCGGDKRIIIYNTGSRKPVTTLSGHKNWVRDLTFSNDGARILSCGDDSRVISWNVSNLSSIKINEISEYGHNWILSTDINFDNKSYVSGGMDCRIRVTSQFVNYYSKTEAPITRVLFKPDEGIYLKVAVATRGQGVFLIDTKNMTSD